MISPLLTRLCMAHAQPRKRLLTHPTRRTGGTLDPSGNTMKTSPTPPPAPDYRVYRTVQHKELAAFHTIRTFKVWRGNTAHAHPRKPLQLFPILGRGETLDPSENTTKTNPNTDTGPRLSRVPHSPTRRDNGLPHHPKAREGAPCPSGMDAREIPG